MQARMFFGLAKKAFKAWRDDYAPSMGAAIAYYTVFSLAPLLIIIIAVAGVVWGEDAVQGEIVNQLTGLVGAEGAQGVQGLIRSANRPVEGGIAAVAGFFFLIIGATTVFAELQSALDRIWRVTAEQKKPGVWNLLRARLLSIGLILGVAFLLLISLVVSAGVAAFSKWAGGLLPGWEFLLLGLNALIAMSITAILFAMIFKFMPQTKIAWRDVWVGAAVTAVLFELGKFLIGLYLGKSAVSSSFAAAGSLVVVLLWVYYAAQVFLFGAEFTRVYAMEHGSYSQAGGHPQGAGQGLPAPDAEAPAGAGRT